MNNHENKHNKKSNKINFFLCSFIGIIFIIVGGTVLQNVNSNILEGIDLHLGRMVSNIGVVLIFIKVIDLFFYTPLSEAINQRNHEIDEAYSQSTKLHTQMKELKSDYEKKLEKTESENKEQFQKQLKEISALKNKIIEESNKKAQKILEQAEEEIQMHRNNVLDELKHKTVDLTLKATEKIIHKNIDTQTNRNLIKEFITELEVKKT